MIVLRNSGEKHAFSLLSNIKDIICGNDTLHYPLANIFIGFETTMYGQIVGIPMGTHAALVADLFCYEYTCLSLSDKNQADMLPSTLFHFNTEY